MTALLATPSTTASTTASTATSTTELRQLVLTHRPLPLPAQFGDGVILLRHGGLKLVHLLVQTGHLPLVVGRIAGGVAVQRSREAEGGPTVALHLLLVALTAGELNPGRPGLLFGEGGAALPFGGFGVGRVALGAEGRALGSEAGFGLDPAGGRAGVGLGGLDLAEEVLFWFWFEL